MTAPTIYALSTPPGRSAIAIVRLSGSGIGGVIAALMPGSADPEPRRAALRRLRHPTSGETLDEALVLRFEAPRSETGEDMLELHLHGSRAVVRAVLDALARIAGLRPAEPGEFARRAFHNGKLDLTAAEGLADLIDAETDSQRRQALAHLSGNLATLYDEWRRRLIEVMALTEAAIDFADEGDVARQVEDETRAMVGSLALRLRQHLDGAGRGEIIRDGYRVVLVGAPNVGKSSLLNALARRDVAIVSAEPGTTRDVIEVPFDLDGIRVVLTDTAGLRDAAGAIEQEGMRRTLARSREADLIVHVAAISEVDAVLPEDIARAAAENRVLRVLNKCDLAGAVERVRSADNALPVSAVTGAGLDRLIAAIAERAANAVSGGPDPVPANARQVAAVTTALCHLDDFLEGKAKAPELRAEDLRLAAAALGTLTGRVDAEAVLGQIFGRFCIGK